MYQLLAVGVGAPLIEAGGRQQAAAAAQRLVASFSSLVQLGSRPQRSVSATRSPSLVSRSTGTIDIGATFQRLGNGVTRVTLKPLISVLGS